MFLSVNSATALASAKVPCEAGALSQPHQDVIHGGRGQEQDMSADSSPTASLVVLLTAREGGDVMWFDTSSNDTTFLLPKNSEFPTHHLLTNEFPNRFNLSLVSYQTKFE